MVVCDGYISPAVGAPLVPAKVLGTAVGDDNGTFKATGTISAGGMILPQTVTGTEKLNTDCTGTISYKQTLGGQPAAPLNITFVVSQHGDRIDGLAVDAGSVFSCVLTRLSMAYPAQFSDATSRKPAASPVRYSAAAILPR
jgi:hypothetical protein